MFLSSEIFSEDSRKIFMKNSGRKTVFRDVFRVSLTRKTYTRDGVRAVNLSTCHDSWFNECPSMPFDGGLGYTSYEVAPSICDASMPVSLKSTRSASHTCTFVHFVHCIHQHINAHGSMHVRRCPSMAGWIIRISSTCNRRVQLR